MIHRFEIGDMRATILSDGPLRLGRPGRIFTDTPAAALGAALAAAGQAPDRIFVEQNCLLLETGGKRVLFDNGMGTDTMFGTACGRLPNSLAEAGVGPETIDALVLTHAHSDHCWGTMGDDGTPNFPNASIYMAEQELAFWTADRITSQDDVSLAGVRKHLLPLRDRIVTLRDGEAFLPGVQAWLTPGHTPGHLAFLFDGGWCLTGDVAFHEPLSYAYPDDRSSYDADPDQGVTTRRRMLDRLASERLNVVGYHHPWPGLGQVERAGGVYRFVAAQAS